MFIILVVIGIVEMLVVLISGFILLFDSLFISLVMSMFVVVFILNVIVLSFKIFKVLIVRNVLVDNFDFIVKLRKIVIVLMSLFWVVLFNLFIMLYFFIKLLK